jgi:hypothetical protein
MMTTNIFLGKVRKMSPFSNQIYYQLSEQKQWTTSGDGGKLAICQGWFDIMLAEGIAHYGNRLTRDRMDIIRRYSTTTFHFKDPLE